MSKNNTLRNRINVVSHDSGSDFVGIKSDGGNPKVYFPLGYKLSETDDEIRRDILQLFSILNEFKNEFEGSIPKRKYDGLVEKFPINAYLEIINYFLDKGYYTEFEPIYKTRSRGKIHWSKTIKQQTPLLSENKRTGLYSPIYTKFTVKQSTPNENKEITRIHKYCVRVSFERVGWIFSSYLPPKQEGKINNKRSITILRSKLSNTNNDIKKRLFQSMIEMLESIDEDEPNNVFHFGTNSFYNVWEALIDKAFGNKDKTKFYPRGHWKLSDGSKKTPPNSLKPDSIMYTEENDYYFVLDSKYYKFGDSRNPDDLPSHADINKQITYAEFLEINKGINSNKIYNAFLIPFNMESSESDDQFVNIGEAVSDWKTNEKKYEHVQGILVDTKFLMNSYQSQSSENIMKLAKAIENAFENNKELY